MENGRQQRVAGKNPEKAKDFLKLNMPESTKPFKTLSREILREAQHHSKAMEKLLGEVVALPSESGQEKKVIQHLLKAAKKTRAFDELRIDGLGNLIASIGKGERRIAIDAHIDTVGVGDPAEWKRDPFQPHIEKGYLYGRGAGDQKGAAPAMLLAGQLIRKHHLLPEGWGLDLTFTVMEEDCDGLCWKYLVEEEKMCPECVIITDSTNCRVMRGQRGRMEIGVTLPGKSCHGSMPEKGDNPVYKLAAVAKEIEQLHQNLHEDPFLGKGSVTISRVSTESPSLCAVPASAYLHLDRRLTRGETRKIALRQIREILKKLKIRGKVEVPPYAEPGWTGLTYPMEKFFPSWCFEDEAPQIQTALEVRQAVFQKPDTARRWTFSTNGVTIAGLYGIPAVGFGPGEETVAHTVWDRVPLKQLPQCAAFYALFPSAFALRTEKEK